MSDDKTNSDRRRFLKTGATLIAAIPVAALVHQREATAKARAEDGHARDYVNDAADAEGHEDYSEGERCDNCAFWSGEEENGWGGCHHPDFRDVLVNADGWCNVWAG